MAFVYEKAEAGRGKSTEDADILTGRFIELVSDKKIVEMVQLKSADPAFADTMTITTLLSAMRDGTNVTFVADHVPPRISAADHRLGMNSSLKNLATLLK